MSTVTISRRSRAIADLLQGIDDADAVMKVAADRIVFEMAKRDVMKVMLKKLLEDVQ